MKLMFVVKDRLNNLSLRLKDAPICSNAVASASAASSPLHYSLRSSQPTWRHRLFFLAI